VILVRPFFGTQSDSWMGRLTAFNSAYPIQFQLKHQSGNILFTVEDVVKIESNTTPTIIRLKGPNHYVAQEICAG
jgi:hypothetical protein